MNQAVENQFVIFVMICCTSVLHHCKLNIFGAAQKTSEDVVPASGKSSVIFYLFYFKEILQTFTQWFHKIICSLILFFSSACFLQSSVADSDSDSTWFEWKWVCSFKARKKLFAAIDYDNVLFTYHCNVSVNRTHHSASSLTFKPITHRRVL